MWRFRSRSYRKGDYLLINVRQSKASATFGFLVISSLVLAVSIMTIVH